MLNVRIAELKKLTTNTIEEIYNLDDKDVVG